MEVVDRLKGQRVLTVDDSRAIRAFLQELLEPHVASVVIAADAAQTRAEFGVGGSFDLVLLDLLLPDVDGMDLLRELRALDPEYAIVLITGAGGVNSATAAVLDGADGYIEKQRTFPSPTSSSSTSPAGLWTASPSGWTASVPAGPSRGVR